MPPDLKLGRVRAHVATAARSLGGHSQGSDWRGAPNAPGSGAEAMAAGGSIARVRSMPFQAARCARRAHSARGARTHISRWSRARLSGRLSSRLKAGTVRRDERARCARAAIPRCSPAARGGAARALRARRPPDGWLTSMRARDSSCRISRWRRRESAARGRSIALPARSRPISILQYRRGTGARRNSCCSPCGPLGARSAPLAEASPAPAMSDGADGGGAAAGRPLHGRAKPVRAV